MDYIWVLPLKVGGTDVFVTLSIARPLSEDEDISKFTEEDIELIAKEAGHWIPNSISIDTRSAEIIEDTVEDCCPQVEDFLYVGGTSKMPSGFALMEDDGELSVQFTSKPALSTSGLQVQQDNNINKNRLHSAYTDQLPLQEGIKYSFTEVQNVFEQYTLEEEIPTGGMLRTVDSMENKNIAISQGIVIVLSILSGIGIFSFGFMKKLD